MFRRLGSKQPDPTEPTRGTSRSQQSFFPSWKHAVDFSNSITNVVHAAFKDSASFTALGGAVFALQQDMHRALGINLWNAHILIKPLFADARMVLPAANQQHLYEELPRLLEILEGIMDVNADFSRQFTDRRGESANQLNADTLGNVLLAGLRNKAADAETLGQVLLAGLRNKAAAIWLLTILPPNRGGNPLAASKIWLRLGAIPMPELGEAAEAITGTYFNGVRTKKFLPNAWPLRFA